VPAGATLRQFGIRALNSCLYILGEEGIRGKEYSNTQRQVVSELRQIVLCFL
jgi:hypothetical protein